MSRADEIERAARRVMLMDAAELCGPGAPGLYDEAMDALNAALNLPPDEAIPFANDEALDAVVAILRRSDLGRGERARTRAGYLRTACACLRATDAARKGE